MQQTDGFRDLVVDQQLSPVTDHRSPVTGHRPPITDHRSTELRDIRAIIVRGHRVASGAGGDQRFPGGTLRLQFPIFQARGLNLHGLHPGTVNVSIAPLRYRIVQPRLTFRGVKWHSSMPVEDFSFCDVLVRGVGAGASAGLIYYPHPETKPEHFQPPEVLELILPYLASLAYGAELRLEAPPEQILFAAAG